MKKEYRTGWIMTFKPSSYFTGAGSVVDLFGTYSDSTRWAKRLWGGFEEDTEALTQDCVVVISALPKPDEASDVMGELSGADMILNCNDRLKDFTEVAPFGLVGESKEKADSRFTFWLKDSSSQWERAVGGKKQ